MIAHLAFIAAHIGRHSIRLLYRILGVSRSWLYAWQRTTPERAARTVRHEALIKEIKATFEENKQRYGAPRIHTELPNRGNSVFRRLIVRLTKENGIRPPRRRRRMLVATFSRHSDSIAPQLFDRHFDITAPDTFWLDDISYLPIDECWLYLAAVTDLETTEIVGWSMSERLKSALSEGALKMAVRNRRPPKGLIHHSDLDV